MSSVQEMEIHGQKIIIPILIGLLRCDIAFVAQSESPSDDLIRVGSRWHTLVSKMASLIDNYEQQYAVLTADITAKIGRIRIQSGGKKSSKRD